MNCGVRQGGILGYLIYFYIVEVPNVSIIYISVVFSLWYKYFQQIEQFF